ncbi:MAG: hypothetical protein ACRC2H_09605, partial [Silanimonas sp.]
MLTITSLVHGPVSVANVLCRTEVAERPVVEHYSAWSVAYVQAGGFTCRCRGKQFERMTGSVLLGRPGDEYVCTHD